MKEVIGPFLRVCRRCHLRGSDVAMAALLTAGFIVCEGLGVALIYPTLYFVEQGVGAFQASNETVLRWSAALIRSAGAEVSLGALVVLTFMAQILRQFFTYARTLSNSRLGNLVRADLQRQAVSAFLKADISFFFKNHRSEVLSSITGHAARASQLYNQGAELIMTVLLLSAYTCTLFFIADVLSIIAVSFALPLLFLLRKRASRANALSRTLTDETLKLGRRLYDDVQGIRLIKMRGEEQFIQRRLFSSIEKLRETYVLTDRTRVMIEACSHPVLMCAVMAAFYFATSVLGYRLSSLAVFILVIMRMIPYVSSLNILRFEMLQAAEALSRYESVVNAARTESRITGGTRIFTGLARSVTFEDVSFAYQTEQGGVPAVRSVCFSVRQGQMTAFVGRSGSGKSTTADMIPRFLEPTSGRILVDGHSIDEYDLTSLRRQIAFITQDIVFFDDTIRANIQFGLDRPLTDDELAEVLRASNCTEFIEALPLGVDTVVGDRGLRLSGGQRQRLAFARALACRPQILILDEPTSALDSESEAAVQETLEQLRGQVTVIVIAHRLATIRKADQIIVLDDGSLVGAGTHEELLDKNERYRKLFDIQMSL